MQFIHEFIMHFLASPPSLHTWLDKLTHSMHGLASPPSLHAWLGKSTCKILHARFFEQHFSASNASLSIAFASAIHPACGVQHLWMYVCGRPEVTFLNVCVQEARSNIVNVCVQEARSGLREDVGTNMRNMRLLKVSHSFAQTCRTCGCWRQGN